METQQQTGEKIAPSGPGSADLETGSTAHGLTGPVPKGYKLGPITLPAYRSPLAQCIMIGFVCFLVVGTIETRNIKPRAGTTSC